MSQSDPVDEGQSDPVDEEGRSKSVLSISRSSSSFPIQQAPGGRRSLPSSPYSSGSLISSVPVSSLVKPC